MEATADTIGKNDWRVSVRYPTLYLWLVFLSSLDVILTRVILFFGGIEVNPIADRVIEEFGVPGMSLFKFSIVAFVIVICEFVASRRPKVGRNLALAAVLITCVPVLWSSSLLIGVAWNGQMLEMEIYPGGDAASQQHAVVSVEQ